MSALTARRPFDSGKLTATLLFLPPALLLFTLFVMMPVVEAAWCTAFQLERLRQPEELDRLRQLPLRVRQPRPSARLPQQHPDLVVSLSIQLPLPLSLALILAEKFRGAVALRMLFFMPYILAEIATGLIFSFVYDGDYGLLAAIFRAFGAQAPHLLASPQTSMLAI